MNRDEALRIAHGRLYPSLRNPNYLVLRSRRLILSSYIRELPAGLTVLDVGGRYQPYRPLLNGKLKTYFALDVNKTELVTVVASGEAIPFLSGSFDLVLATCVFEYFRDPFQAAREVYRVLKPGGWLMASVAAVAPRFGDEEHWRFLPLGLRNLFSQFSELRIVPEVSTPGGFFRLVNLGMHDFLKLGLLKTAYEWSFCPILNLGGLLLERAHLTSNDNWAGNYSILAVK